jgi:uncharacterized protein YicC (UPF0701 family)
VENDALARLLALRRVVVDELEALRRLVDKEILSLADQMGAPEPTFDEDRDELRRAFWRQVDTHTVELRADREQEEPQMSVSALAERLRDGPTA